ncbi:protein translocase subunit SecD [uncultured Paludibaculum sp.]|uniref:protein translocase subunit SecD n=1 Tax=uncultured Paludibaculum sp. TaxID=1765020 RepID=UPI002AAB9C03|nr:protein translocase subunit SecD [uncultured Paludibaculum sp.]
MPSRLRWKWIVIAAVLLGCVAGIVGLPTTADQLAANWKKSMRLGLDLQGGSHIVLQIQVQDAFKAEADLLIERLTGTLQKEQIPFGSMERNDPASIETADSIQVDVRGVPAEKAGDFRRVATDAISSEWTLTPLGPDSYRINIRKEAAVQLRQDTLARSMNTIEKKINGLGVAESSVQQRGGSGGETELLVQLPGVDDPARVKSILQTSALLELCEVKAGPFASREAALGQNGGVLPLNTKLVQGTTRAGSGRETVWYLLSRSPVITGRDLRDSRPMAGENPGQWDTSFVLTQDAAQRFQRFTSANIGRQLAIVLDHNVISAPRIDSAISDQGRIMGAADQQTAADLALNLRSGSLPAGAKVIEERTVGPSLGADSIRRGLLAGLVGLGLVVASMVAYYRGAGINSVIALMLNTLMTVAGLSFIDATWTLPGIAGLVLSIGMAVDSNVLIFERIKEELRGGKGVAAAIGAGFDRALTIIIDTHVTTVVASAFLFMFGTGPVRGFAVTLVIGLLANLFTAVFVSRAIFDLKVWRNPRLTHLSIGKEMFEQPNIDFLSRRTLTLGLSVLAIVISIGSLVMKGGPKYGLDFRGGSLISVKFDSKPSLDQLRGFLSDRLPGAVSLQESRGTNEVLIGTELADDSQLEKTRQTVEQTLREKYGLPGGKLDLNTTSVGALTEKLWTALPAAGVSLGDQERHDLAKRILDYRDKVGGGLIGQMDDLSKVQGVDGKVLSALKQETGLGHFNIRSAEIVGPKAGAHLRQQALMATLFALGGMLLYVAFRFEWRSGAAAVIATIHDVVITLGLFSLTNREIDLNILAALLTLIGYSMNDKIVVFDRVRENMQHGARGRSFLALVNESINQTLSRTLLTAGPTLLACLALYFLGGEVLNGIAFALFAGVVVGTYSSIFVASALLVMWHSRKQRVAPPPAAVEAIPAKQ